jgi:hypothetical protein
MPSPQPSPVPATVSCSTTPADAAEPLVLAESVDSQGVSHILLDSLSDPTHQSTLCTIGGAEIARFVSPTEIGYVTNSLSNSAPIQGTSRITQMSLTDFKAVTVVAVQGDVMDVAWSADGSTVAYLLYTEDANGAANQLWLKVGSATPRALTPPIPLFGRDGSVNDQILVRFSPDEKYVVMVDTYLAGAAPASSDQAIIQVHSVPDGGLVWVPPSALVASGNKGGPYVTMVAWSHQTDHLYYRDQAGVHVWDPSGTVSTMVTGLAWYSPSVSPDDRFIAYALNVGGQPHIEVRDLISSSVRVIPGTLGQPILLTDDELIESHFVPNTQGLGPPYHSTGVYVLNLVTNAETPLLVNPAVSPFSSPFVIDTWPR